MATKQNETASPPEDRLSKSLGLFDVYVISTGAMFSAGFFLLPGLAASKTGSSVILVYVLAGVLLIPAMLSLSELSTAMPRAGGIYFALDRALGPMMGTVGGLATWLSILFKSAFALIGMGAYLALMMDVPVKPVAIGATVAIVLLNLIGARETTRLQRVLVLAVLAVLGLFLFEGIRSVAGGDAIGPGMRDDFMTHGATGFIATIGLVIVSFAGLLKVASISEEVADPDRNIPMGMGLSLLTAIVVYGIGVWLMVRLIGMSEIVDDLTPVATAGRQALGWLPEQWAVGVIVVAAVLAFAAMANAGLMSASRYPLAMARDHLLPKMFAKLVRQHTPVTAILLTGGVMIAVLALLDVEAVAKLASALMLLVFGLVNLAVIVMRETEIESYDPGFRSPGYPWLQLIGLVVPLWLIVEMGHAPVLFTLGVTTVAFGWFFYYARDKVARGGGIFHVFERLGRMRFEGLERELRSILREKGIRDEDPFEDVVTRAAVVDAADSYRFEDIVRAASEQLAERLDMDAADLRERFYFGTRFGQTPIAHGVAMPHLRLSGIEESELVLVRSINGIRIGGTAVPQARDDMPLVHACFFLVSPESEPGRHLRLLAEIASRVDTEDFMSRWLAADSSELRSALMGEQHFLSLRLDDGSTASQLIGQAVRELDLPEGSLIAIIHRNGKIIVPRGDTQLMADDRLTIIGDPAGIRQIQERYGGSLAENTRALPVASE